MLEILEWIAQGKKKVVTKPLTKIYGTRSQAFASKKMLPFTSLGPTPRLVANAMCFFTLRVGPWISLKTYSNNIYFLKMQHFPWKIFLPFLSFYSHKQNHPQSLCQVWNPGLISLWPIKHFSGALLFLKKPSQILTTKLELFPFVYFPPWLLLNLFFSFCP